MTVVYQGGILFRLPVAHLQPALLTTGPAVFPRALSASDAQSATFAGQVSAFRSLAATDGQATAFARLAARFRSFSAIDAQAVSPQKRTSKLLSAGLPTLIFGGGGSITDLSSHVWTIVGDEAFEDGAPPAFSANVIALFLFQGVIWIINTSYQSYFWNGSAWIAGPNPDAGGQSLTLVETATRPLSLLSVDAEAARIIKVVSKVALAVVDAQVTSIQRLVSFFRSFSTTGAEALSLVRRSSYFRTLAATSSQIAALIALHAFGRAVSAVDAQVASVARQVSAFRNLNAVDAGVAAFARQVSAFRAFVAAEGQAVSLVRLRAAFRSLTAADGQATALARQVSAFRLLSVADSEAVALIALHAFGRSLAASDAQVAARTLLVSIVRSASDAQQAVLAVFGLHPRVFNVVDAEAVTAQRASGIIRGATAGSAAARTVLVAISRAVASAEVTSVNRLLSIARSASNAQASARTLLVSIIRKAADAQVVSSVASAIRNLVLSAIDAEIAHLMPTFIHAGVNTGKALSALSAEAAAVIKTTAKLLAGASTEVAQLSRTVAALRLFQAADGAVVRLLKSTGLLRGAFGGQVGARTLLVSVIRRATGAQTTALLALHAFGRAVAATNAQTSSHTLLVSILRGGPALQAVGRTLLASILRGAIDTNIANRAIGQPKKLSLTSTEVAALIALHAFGRAVAAVSSEVAVLARSALHLFAPSSASSSAVGLVKAVGLHLSGLAANTAALARAMACSARTIQTANVAIAVAVARRLTLALSQTQAAALIPFHGSSFVAHISLSFVSAGVAALAKGYARALSSTNPSKGALVIWYHRFLPLALRRRVVRLPDPQQMVALPPAARRVLLPDAQLLVMLPPSVRRVVLPREEDEMSDYSVYQPEPRFFSPLDPTDTDTFTFDWSTRGYPGDAIVFASIISVPAGVNFLGPTFIDGQLVEITIGPFLITPSQMPLPMTYALRCMAMFASGRISNFSVPFIVKQL